VLNTMTTIMRPTTAAPSAHGGYDIPSVAAAASAWRVAAQAVTSAAAATSYERSDLLPTVNHNSIVRAADPAGAPNARRGRFGSAKQASPPRGVPR